MIYIYKKIIEFIWFIGKIFKIPFRLPNLPESLVIDTTLPFEDMEKHYKNGLINLIWRTLDEKGERRIFYGVMMHFNTKKDDSFYMLIEKGMKK